MANTPATSDWEKITLFAFGTICFTGLVAIALFDKHPSSTSWFIYVSVLSLAAGGIAALLPGAINVDLKPGIRATGAIAFAVIVFWFGKNLELHDQVLRSLRSTLDGPERSGIDPGSDVYVVINSKLALYDRGGHATKDLDFGSNVWKGEKTATVERGMGGIQILYGDLASGDKINIISKDSSGRWWISDDLTVPGGELAMRSADLAAVTTRFGK
jgi:hypothetical protein